MMMMMMDDDDDDELCSVVLFHFMLWYGVAPTWSVGLAVSITFRHCHSACLCAILSKSEMQLRHEERISSHGHY
jgi:hypothetical protein